jgi:AcrR family transcriptional regulator
MPRSAPIAARVTRVERKRQLLLHATQVFAERGYHGTTPELVADVAGVPEAILSKHFADLPALFSEVLADVREATIERWRSATAMLPDPLAKLHVIAEVLLGDACADAPEMRLVKRSLAECDSEEIAAPLRTFFCDCETFLAGILEEGQQAGVFRRSPDPRVGAWQLLHAGLGQVATCSLDIPSHREPDSLTRAVECLLHGLLKTDV